MIARTVRWTLGILVLLAVGLAMLGAAALVFLVPEEVGPITVNGELIEVAPTLIHWAMATGGLLIAGFLVLVIAPFSLLVGLGLPLLMGALVLAGVLLSLGAVAALLLSPLLLVVGLVLMLRSRKPRGGTTIAR